MHHQPSARIKEVLRFAFSGGICFVVEFIALILLRDGAKLDTLLATPIAFALSVVINYLLCMAWVFPGTKDGGRNAKIGFALTSMIGLFLNEGLMFLFRLLWGEDGVILTLMGFTITMYMFSKVLATLLVMVWNYFTKRIVLTSGFLARQNDRK